MEEQSLEELQAKLAQYQEQLGQVIMCIEADPTNEQFISLRGDLEEVVQITEQLISHRMASGPGGDTDGEALDTEAQGEPLPEEEDAQQQEAAAPPQPALEPIYDDPITTTSAPIIMSNIEKGAVYEINKDGAWLPVLVEEVGELIAVFFITVGTREDVDASRLKVILNSNPVTRAMALVGYTCQAKYPPDGKWYNAKVAGVQGEFYRVAFTDYGNEETVPLEFMRAILQAPKSSSDQKTIGGAIVGPDGMLEIPKNLEILPTDSDKERERKKKRVKAIKKANERKEKELYRETKKKGWNDFAKKVGKNKKVKGFVSSGFKKKRSIFQSPESVDGKVGVVGSGNKQTEFEARKKYKFVHGT